MGRLFWSYRRAMKTDCLIIVMALEGQNEFLTTFFGKAEGDEQGASAPQPKQNVSSRPLTPSLFMALFQRKGKGR
jgi:hypothetical protein